MIGLMERHSVYYDNFDEPKKIAEFDLFFEAQNFLLKNYRADITQADELIEEDDYVLAKFFDVDGKTLIVSIERNSDA